LTIALTCLAVAQAQFGMRADIFNPLRNPNHPANVAFSNAMAIRSQFVWPGAPVIRNPWMPPIANKPVVNDDKEAPKVPLFPGMAIRADVLNSLAPAIAQRKVIVNDHVQKMIDQQAAGIPGFRPDFVNEKLKKIEEIKEVAVSKRLELAEERQEALKDLFESGDALEFGSVMKALGKAHGKKMAEKQIEFRKQMIETFDKPFLRPQIELAQLGISKGEKIRTQIFQNFKEKVGTLVKGEEFFIITRVANFTGDALDIKVHIDSVKEAVKNLTLERIEKQLQIRDSMISQLMEARKANPSDFIQDRIDSQVKFIKKGTSLMRPEGIADWVSGIIKENQDLAQQRIEAQQNLVAQQIQFGQAMAAKRIAMQKEIAAKAINMQMDIAAQNIKLQQDIRKKALEETRKVLEGKEILVANPEVVDEALQGIIDPIVEKQVEVAEKVEQVVQDQKEKVEQVVQEKQEKVEEVVQDQQEQVVEQVQQVPQVQQVQQVQQPQQLSPFFMGPKRHPFFG